MRAKTAYHPGPFFRVYAMLLDYANVLVFMVLGALFVVVNLFISRLVRRLLTPEWTQGCIRTSKVIHVLSAWPPIWAQTSISLDHDHSCSWLLAVVIATMIARVP